MTEQAAARCKHFTGLRIGAHGAECCKQGVNYEQAFDGGRDGIVYRLPCNGARQGETTQCGVVGRCRMYEVFTAEELAVREAERDASMADISLAVGKVREVFMRGGPTQGSIDCPVCSSGTLLYSLAANGHLSGRCSTKRCVFWMQ